MRPCAAPPRAARAAIAQGDSDERSRGNLPEGPEPSWPEEDFSYLLENKPGCFMFIGNGEGEGGCSIHNPNYDFNDDVLTLGSSYWVKLAESFLSEAVVD